MKKKIKLNDLQVKSFVTEVNSETVKGGTAANTYQSCLAYVTCNAIKCYVTTQAPACITNTIEI